MAERCPARILVLEDNDADVFLIEKALRDFDIPAEITLCEDGEGAMRMLTSHGASAIPDAIILDLALPRVEGVTVLQSILSRPALASVPVMILTTSPSTADRHRVELLGRVRYFQKPSGVDEFLRVVSEGVKEMLGAPPKPLSGALS